MPPLCLENAADFQRAVEGSFVKENYLFLHIHSSTPFSEEVTRKSQPMLSTIHLPVMFMK